MVFWPSDLALDWPSKLLRIANKYKSQFSFSLWFSFFFAWDTPPNWVTRLVTPTKRKRLGSSSSARRWRKKNNVWARQSGTTYDLPFYILLQSSSTRDENPTTMVYIPDFISLYFVIHGKRWKLFFKSTHIVFILKTK